MLPVLTEPPLITLVNQLIFSMPFAVFKSDMSCHFLSFSGNILMHLLMHPLPQGGGGVGGRVLSAAELLMVVQGYAGQCPRRTVGGHRRIERGKAAAARERDPSADDA